MKNHLYLSVISILLATVHSQTTEENDFHHVRSKDLFTSNINNIIQDIVQQHWSNEETPCLQKTLDILESVKNRTLWATWVWDSMQSPTGVLFGSRNQLGNFDECINPPWAKTNPELLTQYCLTEITLGDKKSKSNEDPYTTADKYIQSISKNKLAVNELSWGLCMPAVCTPNSVKKFAKTLLSNSHLAFASPRATINIHSCQKKEETSGYSLGSFAAIAFIGSMAFLTLYMSNYYENNRYTKKDHYSVTLAKAFSVKDNVAELFKNKDDEILSLNSLRAMSALIIIYQHIIIIFYELGYKNVKGFDRFIERNQFYVLFHGDVVVDTFFMISGILLIKSFLASNKPVNVVNTLVKRYFRLIYVTTIVMLYNAQIMKFNATGPWARDLPTVEIQACKDNWWKNVLMISNYCDFMTTCMPVTWSIASDFHFTIVGTLLFWLYQKNKRLAVKLYFIGFIASIILPAVDWYRIGTSITNFGDLGEWRHARSTFNDSLYLHSHLRGGPYFVGLAFGFLLSELKPSAYKKLPKTFSTLVFITGAVLGIFIFTYGGHLHHRKHSALEGALYAGTNRSIWALAVGIIVLSCEYGTVPLLTSFLRWPGFGVLSKLSFGVYLTHWPIIIAKIAYNTQSDVFSLTYSFIDALGVLTFCLGLAFILWILFEAPMSNLVAILLRKRSSKKISNEVNEMKEIEQSEEMKKEL